MCTGTLAHCDQAVMMSEWQALPRGRGPHQARRRRHRRRHRRGCSRRHRRGRVSPTPSRQATATCGPLRRDNNTRWGVPSRSLSTVGAAWERQRAGALCGRQEKRSHSRTRPTPHRIGTDSGPSPPPDLRRERFQPPTGSAPSEVPTPHRIGTERGSPPPTGSAPREVPAPHRIGTEQSAQVAYLF